MIAEKVPILLCPVRVIAKKVPITRHLVHAQHQAQRYQDQHHNRQAKVALVVVRQQIKVKQNLRHHHQHLT